MAAPGGLCIGCLRSLDEITVWSKIDDAARTRILTTISQRRRALAAAGAPLSTKGNADLFETVRAEPVEALENTGIALR